MLAAAVLASLWAQAEQAPPEPAEPPAQSAPAPAQAGPAEPAPAEPGPAEPAPPEPGAAPPAPTESEPATLASGVAMLGRIAYRPDTGGQTLGPPAGFSVGVTFERRYLALPSGIELGAAADLFYDRFSTTVVDVSPVVSGTPNDARVLSQTSFTFLQTVGVRTGGLRPYAGVGVGLGVAYFSTPELTLSPRSTSGVQPIARAAAGVDVAFTRTGSITIRADYTRTFAAPTVTSDQGGTYALFGDILDVGVGLLVRF